MSVAAKFPDLGQVHALAGAAIKNAYGAGTVSNPLYLGLLGRVRFYVHVVTDPASALTSVTIKLKHRYRSKGSAVLLGYIDLASDKDDAAKTLEIEHAYVVAAAGDASFSFFLDRPQAISELALDVKANANGQGADAVTVFAVAG